MKNIVKFFAMSFILSASISSAQIGPFEGGYIFTVAGNGLHGFFGDGAPAIDAELNLPLNVTLDHAGNIYIADTSNNRIRKVAADNGIITTFAGNGSYGFSGDGGPAIDAEFELTEDYMEGNPIDTAVVADAAGNIYISDQGNNRIRKVDAATGTISTYAGTGSQEISGDGDDARAAGIPAPGGLAIDASGNLYITEFNMVRNGGPEFNVVRKVDAAPGIVSTVAGNGIYGTSGDGGPATSAELEGPYQVALDGAGNLYIEEVNYPRVRKVDATTGIITTVAGNGTVGLFGGGQPAVSAEFLQPSGLAVDAAGDIYISDVGSNVICRVDAVTGFIELYAGDYSVPPPLGDGGPATSAALGGPWGLALDAAGDLYLADSGDQRIRVVGAEELAVADTTTTTLTVSANELNYGQPLTLTATVTPKFGNAPSGTVSFISGTTWLASTVLNARGVATVTMTPDAGSYSLTAAYNGSPKDQGSVSAPPIEVIINPDPTTTVLTASANPSPFADTVTFTATVSSPVDGSIVKPLGLASFYDGTVLLATKNVVYGVATYSTSALSVGSHNITAVFAANTDFNASTSNLVVEIISPGDFSISASPGSQSVYTGEAASYTVIITPGKGFDFPVALSCTQLPANSSCSFSPATVNGGTWSSTLAVQTTPPIPAATASVFSSKLRVTALAGLFLLILPSRLRRSRKGWPLFLVFLAILAAGTAIMGCSAPSSLTGGTPVGAQTVAVTGISNNGVQILTHTVNVTLNVNSLF